MDGFVERKKLERLVCSERFRVAMESAMLAKYGRRGCLELGFRKGGVDGVESACPGIMGFRLGPSWARNNAYPLFDGEMARLPLVLATLPGNLPTYPDKFEQIGLQVLFGLLLEGGIQQAQGVKGVAGSLPRRLAPASLLSEKGYNFNVTDASLWRSGTGVVMMAGGGFETEKPLGILMSYLFLSFGHAVSLQAEYLPLEITLCPPDGFPLKIRHQHEPLLTVRFYHYDVLLTDLMEFHGMLGDDL